MILALFLRNKKYNFEYNYFCDITVLGVLDNQK